MAHIVAHVDMLAEHRHHQRAERLQSETLEGSFPTYSTIVPIIRTPKKVSRILGKLHVSDSNPGLRVRSHLEYSPPSGRFLKAAWAT